MVSKFPCHQLSNGLVVSGRPEQARERLPTMSTLAVPYTGNDRKKEIELGKLLMHRELPKNPNSRALSKKGELLKKSSSPQSGRQNPRPNSLLPATGLITSGANASEGLMMSQKMPGLEHAFCCLKSFLKHVLWLVVLTFLTAFLGGFILGGVDDPTLRVIVEILFIIVAILFIGVAILFIWNACWGLRGLRTAENDQYMKVTRSQELRLLDLHSSSTSRLENCPRTLQL